MSRSLKIPIFFQPTTKPYCGPTCIKMILSFYGKNFSLKELVGKLPMISTGIDMCSMGLFFMDLGFESTIFINKNSADAKNPAYKLTTPVFIEMGGLLITRAIRISDIKKFLARKCPVILNIENSNGDGHFVVVRNVGGKRVTINCPGYGLRRLSIKRLMKACHNWTGGAIIARLPEL